jgi:hypothetical protein
LIFEAIKKILEGE